jgi:hypothetical protein
VVSIVHRVLAELQDVVARKTSEPGSMVKDLWNRSIGRYQHRHVKAVA